MNKIIIVLGIMLFLFLFPIIVSANDLENQYLVVDNQFETTNVQHPCTSNQDNITCADNLDQQVNNYLANHSNNEYHPHYIGTKYFNAQKVYHVQESCFH